jgi:flap endonuclease-1
MGIKNINKIAKEKSPNAFKEINISSLKGKRIAIDAAIWLYTNVASITKYTVSKMSDILLDIDRNIIVQQLILNGLKFHLSLMDFDIIPIWLADGETPIEKINTRIKRKAVRNKQKDKIDVLKSRIMSQDILMRDSKDVAELRKLLSNNALILPGEFATFFEAMRSFGAIVIDCPGEAEAYGSSMNAKNLVYGVWSTDSDCYAIGAVNMITGFGSGYQTLAVTHVPTLLEDLKLDPVEMRDFCILCGTDFNDNIPKIGSTRSYNIIVKYRSIETFESETGTDCSILNYERVRTILSLPECKLEHNSIELCHDVKKFESQSGEVCLRYQLEEVYDKMYHHITRPIKVLYGNTVEINIINVVKKSKTVDKPIASLDDLLGRVSKRR